jgi:hypothetical protein
VSDSNNRNNLARVIYNCNFPLYQKVSEGGDDNADGQADGDEDGHEGPERRRPALRAARRR